MSRNHVGLNRQRLARVRREVLERDAWTCQRCGKIGGRLEIDHKVPLSQDSSNPYALDGVQVLCRNCHFQKTAGENTKPNPERDAWQTILEQYLKP